MFLSQAYLWPLVTMAGVTVVVAVLRCLTLFIGLRLTLNGARRDDRVEIYREFARALTPQTRAKLPVTFSRRGRRRQ